MKEKQHEKVIREHLDFFKAIERIKNAGIISLKTNREKLFYSALNELTEIINLGISLAKKDDLKYEAIFKTDRHLLNRYNSRYLDVLYSQNDGEENKIIIESHDNIYIPKKGKYYGFQFLISTLCELRDEAFNLNGTESAQNVNESLIELINHANGLVRRKDDVYKLEFEIEVLINAIVFQKDYNSQDDNLKIQGFYIWYFNSLFKLDFKIGKLLQILDRGFSLAFKRAIEYDELSTLKSLALELSQGFNVQNIHWSYEIQSLELGPQDNRKLNDEKIKQLQHEVSKVYTIKEYQETEKDFLKLIKELEKHTPTRKTEIDGIRDYIIGSLKSNFIFNHLRLNLIQLLTYAFFKKKYNAVNLFLNFNQPLGGKIKFSDKDILPNHPSEIKEIILRIRNMESIFLHLWEFSRNSEPVLNNFIVILLARRFYLNNSLNFTDFNCRGTFEKREVQRFFNGLQTEKLNEILIEEIYQVFDETFVEKFNTEIIKVKKQIDNDLKIEWLNTPAEQKTIEKFCKDVLKEMETNPSLFKLFKHYGAVEDKSHEEHIEGLIAFEHVGINRIDPKGYFLENQTGVSYLNWSSSYSKMIRVELDYFILSEMLKLQNFETENTINDLLHKIQMMDLSQKVIVAINLPISRSVFYSDIKFTNANKKLELGLVGQYGESEVYEFNLPTLREELVLILDKYDFGKIYRDKPDDAQTTVDSDNLDLLEDNVFFCVKDFVSDPSLISFIINKELGWMQQMSPKEKENKLKDSVWIRYKEKLAYRQPTSPLICFKLIT